MTNKFFAGQRVWVKPHTMSTSKASEPGKKTVVYRLRKMTTGTIDRVVPRHGLCLVTLRVNGKVYSGKPLSFGSLVARD